MNIPELPIRKSGTSNFLRVILNDTILDDYYCNLLSTNPNLELFIVYSGSSRILDRLFLQLSQFKYNTITININKCYIDRNICLPFYILGDNIEISFGDTAKNGSSLNEYLMDCNETVFRQAINKLELKHRARLIAERIYRDRVIDTVSTILYKRGIYLDSLSNEQKMHLFFKYIKSTYPYDFSLVNPDGSWKDLSTTELGGTAKAVYERGMGVCEGRSKLLKIATNNRIVDIPCYIVEGYFGPKNAHVWNEFITDDGEIMEYDLSTGLICTLDELLEKHKVYNRIEHEVQIEKVLKR